MAKATNTAAKLTRELPGLPGRPGRPPKADTLTPAERQATYRARRAEAIEAETAKLADLPCSTLARRLANHLVAAQNASRVRAGGEAEDHAKREWLAIGKRMGWI